MMKKKVTPKDSPPSAPPTRGGEAESRAEGPQLYTVGEWKGLPQWKCAWCPGDTLVSEDEMRAHIREVHLPKPEKPPARKLPLVDRFGNQLTVDGSQ